MYRCKKKYYLCGLIWIVRFHRGISLWVSLIRVKK